LFLILTGSSAAHAHEIGTTRVSVNFAQGASYQIDVVTDAMSLVEKLTGQTPASDSRAAILQKQLQDNDALFRQRVIIGFDGAAAIPAIDYAVSGVATPTSSPEATIRLHGTTPHNASQFTWTYSWTFATYSLNVGDAAIQWLEGGQTSTPVSLTLRNAPIKRITTGLRYLSLGFTHIVPNGFDHMLF